MLRLLHLIPSVAGGGAERQLAQLAGGLRELGWEVHVAHIHPGANAPRFGAAGAILHPLPAFGNHDPVLLLRLMRLVKALHPALIHTWITQMDVLGGLAARLTDTPWVLSEQSSASAYPATWKNRLRARLAKGAALIVSNSRGGDAYWEPRLPRSVRRRVIPNGIPIAEIERAVAGTPGPSDEELVVSAGRFVPEKNPETLVAALARLAPERPRLRAALLGEGPMRPLLEAAIAAGALAGRVVLPGFVEDAWTWMKRARAFVSLSRFEGQPNAVQEAMACGSPLVVSDIPAHREFLDDDTARLVDPDDPVAAAAAIAEVLDQPGAAAARARRARGRIEPLSVAAAARRWDEAYRELLRARAGP